MNFGSVLPRFALTATVTALAGAAFALPAAPAGAAPTSANLTATLSPGRTPTTASLQLTVHFTGGEAGVPPPLRRVALRLPTGLGVEIPQLRSCRSALLIAHGVHGCPAASLIGNGYALVEGELGAQLVQAPVRLHAFLGPPRNLQPTFEILSEGNKPIGTQMLFTATAQPAAAPYGEELVMALPLISAAPNEPDVSLLTLSLTIGADSGSHAATVRLPAHCPAGGLPFASEFNYADGSTGSAHTTASCPHTRKPAGHVRAARKPAGHTRGARSAVGQARAARSVALNEHGALHLVSKHGFTLYEQGPASGTVSGTLNVRLQIVSTSHVTAQVSLSSRDGSITGTASAGYHRGSTSASFSGTLSIVHGTGSYANAHGSDLSFSGTIQRSNDAISAHVGGTVSE